MNLQTAKQMVQNGNYRMAAVEACPNRLFTHIYNAATDDNTELKYKPDRLSELVRWGEMIYYLPRPKDALRITHIGENPTQRVRDRYTNGGDFAPQPDDFVVDVGAFIGELSWQLTGIDNVDRVLAVEPDPKNWLCGKKNTPESVDVIGFGCWHMDTTKTFNTASDGSESSIRVPDSGSWEQTEVEVRRLDSILDEEPDWVKVEAEGSEPEVLMGLGEIRPERIVVNVSAERDGKSPYIHCDGILSGMGYKTELKEDTDMLFAQYSG